MCYPAMEIERGRAFERDMNEVARDRIARKMNRAVHAGRLAHRTARPAAPRAILDQNANRAADAPRPGRLRCGALSFAQAHQAAALFAGRHVIRKRRARSALLAAVLKKPDAIELRARDPLLHIIYVFFALARKPDNEGRAHRCTRNAAAEIFQNLQVPFAVSGAQHRAQNLGMRVLQRHVDVLANLRQLSDRGDQFAIDRGRIEIEQTDPFQTFNFVQAAQQMRQTAAAPTSSAGLKDSRTNPSRSQ